MCVCFCLREECVLRGWISLDVIGPCLSPWLMAIGHRLSPLYFFCAPALSFQVSHWYSTLRHCIIYCCQEPHRRGGEGADEGEAQEYVCRWCVCVWCRRQRRCAAGGSQWRQWGEAGMLDCQISALEYLMEPAVFI